jgi:hypothetical protein
VVPRLPFAQKESRIQNHLNRLHEPVEERIVNCHYALHLLVDLSVISNIYAASLNSGLTAFEEYRIIGGKRGDSSSISEWAAPPFVSGFQKLRRGGAVCPISAGGPSACSQFFAPSESALAFQRLPEDSRKASNHRTWRNLAQIAVHDDIRATLNPLAPRRRQSTSDRRMEARVAEGEVGALARVDGRSPIALDAIRRFASSKPGCFRPLAERPPIRSSGVLGSMPVARLCALSREMPPTSTPGFAAQAICAESEQGEPTAVKRSLLTPKAQARKLRSDARAERCFARWLLCETARVNRGAAALGKAFLGLLVLTLGLGVSGARAQSAPNVFSPSPEVQQLAPQDLPAVDSLSLVSPLVRNIKKLARDGSPKDSDYGWGNLTWGDWSARSVVTLEPGFTDNVFYTPIDRVPTGFGHLAPIVGMFRSTGLYSTTIYASGDFDFYTRTPIPNTLYSRAGVMQVFSPTNDLKVIARGDFGHYAWGFSNGIIFSPLGVSTTSATSNIYTSALQYDQYVASLAAIKSFDKAFIGLGASVTRSTYDTVYTQFGPYGQYMRDSVLAAVTGRTGYALAPEIYLFASPTGYSRSYDHNAQYNSDGYQLLAGVGLDRRLWTIELGGGYQQQFYLNSPIRTVSAPAVNATAIWRPTRLVTLSAFATESIQDPGLSPGPSPSLQVNRVLNSGVSADYEFSARLSAQIRGGFSELTQVNGGARADLWNGEARVVYNVTRNIKAYVDYSFARSLSATAYDEYMRNAVLIGFKCSY